MRIEIANLNRQQSHDLIANSIAPLPVVFISTIGQNGVYNAAPFSFIAPVCSKPAIICASFGLKQGQKKDTVRNIEFSRDFVINVVDESLIQQALNAAADYPSDVDEIKEVGLTAIRSEKVKSPRIAESRVSLECRLVQKLELLEEQREGWGLRAVIFGEVLLAHVKDELWVDGKIDPSRLGAIGRIGADMYYGTKGIFSLKRQRS